MSFIFSESHKETAEVEFGKKHPDVFGSHLASKYVELLAEIANADGKIGAFRSDLSVQAYATSNFREGTATPIRINIAGQLVTPIAVNSQLESAASRATHNLLEQAGYFMHGDYSSERTSINLEGITSQSPNLNGTTQKNLFADSCVVYGHYIAQPFGINGTFPSLAVGQDIDKSLDKALQHGEIAELRPDGKVHVTVEHTGNGFTINKVYLSAAMQKGFDNSAKQKVITSILKNTTFKALKDAEFTVNAGGSFNVYFLAADFGMSKVKDCVIITGGLHQLGTDAVWGKCLYKASSTLIPYAFALSRAVCEATGAKYASVAAHSEYGHAEATLQLQEIEHEHERLRKQLNSAMEKLPRDRDGIREITGMPVTIESYRLFNDVGGFHEMTKPWKRRNGQLERELKKALG